MSQVVDVRITAADVRPNDSIAAIAAPTRYRTVASVRLRMDKRYGPSVVLTFDKGVPWEAAPDVPLLRREVV